MNTTRSCTFLKLQDLTLPIVSQGKPKLSHPSGNHAPNPLLPTHLQSHPSANACWKDPSGILTSGVLFDVLTPQPPHLLPPLSECPAFLSMLPPSRAASQHPSWPAVTFAPDSLRWKEAPKGEDSPLALQERGWGPGLLAVPPGTPHSVSLICDCVNTLYFPSFPPGQHVECEQAVCKMVVGSVGAHRRAPRCPLWSPDIVTLRSG